MAEVDREWREKVNVPHCDLQQNGSSRRLTLPQQGGNPACCSHLRPVPSFPLIAAGVVLAFLLCFRPCGRIAFPLGVGARHSPFLGPFATVGRALGDTI